MNAYETINIITSRPNSVQKFNFVALSENSIFKPDDTLKLGEELGLESVVLTAEQAEDFGLWLILNTTARIVYVPGVISPITRNILLQKFAENKREITIIYNGYENDNVLSMVMANRSVWV